MRPEQQDSSLSYSLGTSKNSLGISTVDMADRFKQIQ